MSDQPSCFTVGDSPPQGIDHGDNGIIDALTLGCHVEVEDRTWPGMNKQGGIARIALIDKIKRCVSVDYVLGGKEKEVPLEFIRVASEYDVVRPSVSSSVQNQHQSTNLRDRSMLLGRCKRCGSLRTDCGSCDWYEEERRLQQGEATSTTKGEATSTTKVTNKKKKQQVNLLESSSEDDELEELLRQNQQTFRRIKRKRARQRKEMKAYFEDHEDEEMQALAKGEPAKKQGKTTKRATTKAAVQVDIFYSSSSSSEDEDVPLMHLALGRPRHGRKSRLSRLQKKYGASPLRSKKRARPNHGIREQKRQSKKKDRATSGSVLESLPTQGETINLAGSNASSSSEEEQIQPSTRSQVTNTGSTRKKKRQPIDNRQIGESNDSEEENMTSVLTMDMDDDEEDPVDQPDAEECQNAQHDDAVNTVVQREIQPMQADGRMLDGEWLDFIEPEGAEAAENLPQDINDRTVSIPYTELPGFFDTEAKLLFDETLPEAKLKVSELERQINTWRAQQGADTPRQQELLSSCDQTMKELRTELIRDGIDQCRSALKQLLDDTRYRKELRNLTQQEQKTMRRHRVVLMENRDLRMDELEGEVEGLMRKMRDLKLDLEDNADEDQYSSSNNDDYSETDTENMALDSDNDDAIRMDQAEPSSPLQSLPRVLPPWDPHKHATRVRNPLSESQAQRKGKGGRLTMPRRRQRVSSNEKGSFNHRKSTSSGHSAKQGKPRRNEDGKSEDESTEIPRSERPAKKSRTQQHNRVTASDIDRDESAISIYNEGSDQVDSEPWGRRRRHFSRRGRSDSITSPDAAIQESGGGNVPRLEDLLPAETWNRNKESEGHRPRARNEGRSIAERMQAFLDSNVGEMSDSSDQSTVEILSNSQSGKTRQQEPRVRRERFQLEQSRGGVAECASASRNHGIQRVHSRRDMRQGTRNRPYPSMGSLHLFEALQDKGTTETQTNPPRRNVNIESSEEDLIGRCQTIETIYKSSDHSEFVPRLKDLVSNIANTIGAGSTCQQSTATQCLCTLLTLLQTHSKATLQESLTRSGNSFHGHITLLTETLLLLGKGVGSHLQSEDGTVFEVFSPTHSRFTKAVVLQLVDSLYSIFHPSAWANPFEQTTTSSQDANTKSSLDILNELVLLRDALAGVTNLTESVCSCITTIMENQTWRIVDAPQKHAFVSSVDPVAWAHFLQTGEGLKKTKDCRLSHFKEHLPRCEVEALWSILAFVAGAKSNSDNDQMRSNSDPVRLVSKILCRGVLSNRVGPEAEATEGKPLPISESQLDACRNEIKFFSLLLRSGAIDNLPKNDDNCRIIIQRAVVLQSEAINASGKHPTLRQANTDARKIKQLWRTFDAQYFDSPAESGTTALALAGDLEFCGQPLILPSSLILRRSLGFLFAWIGVVSVKKPRLNRLVSGMRLLFKDLIDEAKLSESPSNGGDSRDVEQLDLFQREFGVVPAAFERGFHLREAAAFLHIMANLSMKSCEKKKGLVKPQTFADEAQKVIWEALADDAMNSRKNNLAQSAMTYKGDDYRLYACAKAVTFSTLASLGVCVWKCDDIETILPEEAPNENSLVSLMQCLVACLDCHCDLGGSEGTMSSLCFYVALTYSHACRVKNQPIFAPAIQALGKATPSMTSKTFRRCFSAITGGSMVGEEKEVCFRSLLAAIRGAGLLAGLVHCPAKPTTAEEGMDEIRNEHADPPNDDEDIWGGIDDEAFAAIDLDALGGTEGAAPPTTEGSKNLFSFLSQALLASKPSSRFSIESSVSAADWSPTPEGRKLIAKNCRYICDCLALLEVQTDQNAAQSILGQLREWDVCEQGDKLYRDELAQLSSASLCNLASVLPSASMMVVSNMESIALSLTSALLDMDILTKFPTCNLPRLELMSGRYGLEQEISRLHALNKVKSNKLGHEVWKFCGSFGRVLTNKSGEGGHGMDISLGEKLVELLRLHDDYRWDMQANSVENECFKRIKVMATIVEVMSKWANESFERLCTRVVVISSSQLLTISKEMTLAKAAVTDKSDPSKHRLAKLTELFSSYVEVHTTLLCLVLRMAPGQQIPRIESLIERYFWTILSKDESAFVHEIYALSGNDTSSSVGATPSMNLDMVRQSLIRRSRDLLLHLAGQEDKARNNRLFAALVAAGCGKGHNGDTQDTFALNRTTFSQTIAESFSPPRFRQQWPLSSSSSPLHDGVDEFIVSHYPILMQTELLSQHLWSLRHTALREHLLHRLWRNQTTQDVQTRTRVVQFVQRILEAGGDAPFALNERGKQVSLSSLGHLARGLASSLRSNLGSGNVSDEFVSALFSCAKVLATCTLSCGSRFNEDPSLMSVVLWSQSTAKRTDDCREVLIASYVWHVFLWIKAVAELLKSRDHQAPGLLHLRNSIKKDEESWPLLKEEEETTLRKLSSGLFPKGRTSRCTNIYAKINEDAGGEISLQTWTPDADTRRSLMNFLVVVVPLCL